MQAAANYIRSGHYREALHVLSELNARTARWFYYSALANAGAGNNIVAREHARQAADMEPSNMEYRSLAGQMESGGQWYRSMGEQYGGGPVINTGDWCMRLCLINMCCGPMCGTRVFCC